MVRSSLWTVRAYKGHGGPEDRPIHIHRERRQLPCSTHLRMASLLPTSPPPPLLTFSSSSSSSYSSPPIHALLLPRPPTEALDPNHLRRGRRTSAPSRGTGHAAVRKPVLRAALDESSVLDPPPQFEETPPELVASLKLKLLNAVSGLNRGLAANEEDLRRAESAAKELEAVGGLVDLSNDLDNLQGRWKLIYSSAFSSRTLGGSRPGPPTGRLLPITLGQVFQRIDILNKDFDNIVELQVGTPWPFPPVEATATLAHKFELIGSAKIKITFEKTTVKPTGSFSQLPPLEVPQLPDALRPPSNTGSGEFEVTYVDADTCITRGDRGELRVFVIS